MDGQLNTSIKAAINSFPEIEKILDEYGIGCGPCSVGDCLLGDIVKIHNLSERDEKALMIRIAHAMDPSSIDESPEMAPVQRLVKGEYKYSPPIKKLVEEHKLIKRCIALLPKIAESIDPENEDYIELVQATVDFIRNFADRYHHAKEEDILFRYFDPGLDILQVMHKEHENGRSHVRSVVEAIEKRDTIAVTGHLLAYGELLTQHIKKEDEILYPWMDRSFDTRQVGELFRSFGEIDNAFGDTERRYREFIENLEKQFYGGQVLDKAFN